MASIPSLRIAWYRSGLSPEPFLRFSALAMIKSGSWSRRRSSRWAMSVRRPGAPLRSPKNANRAALGDFLASERPVSVVGWLCMGPARYTSDVEFGGWSQSRSCPSAADESDFGVDSSVCLESSPLARLAAKVFLPPCQGIRAWLISIRLWLVLDDDDVDFDVINQFQTRSTHSCRGHCV